MALVGFHLNRSNSKAVGYLLETIDFISSCKMLRPPLLMMGLNYSSFTAVPLAVTISMPFLIVS